MALLQFPSKKSISGSFAAECSNTLIELLAIFFSLSFGINQEVYSRFIRALSVTFWPGKKTKQQLKDTKRGTPDTDYNYLCVFHCEQLLL